MGDQLALGPTEDRMAEIARLLRSAASEVDTLLTDLGTYPGHLTGKPRRWRDRRVNVTRFGVIPAALTALADLVAQSAPEAPESEEVNPKPITPEPPKR